MVLKNIIIRKTHFIIGIITLFLLIQIQITTQNNTGYGILDNDPQLVDPNLKVEEVIDGLKMPTSMAFIDTSDFLVLEKNGTVLRITNGTILDVPVLQVPVATGFYQGLLGITVMKNLTTANNINVYLYYTEVQNNSQKDVTETKDNDTSVLGNRLYSYKLVNNELIEPKMLLDLPAIPGPEDNGGFITFGPDNHIYLTIGGVDDPFNKIPHKTLTQNYDNSSIIDGRAGILRITTDGNPVINENGQGILGNTFPLNLYYAYGIHNGFGMDFDPLTGNLWNTETGHMINDEINIVKPGFNSGFGIIQGQSSYFPAAPEALVDFDGKGKYKDPEFVWEEKTVPTGLKFLTSDKLGTQYKNDMFVGTYLDGNVYHFELSQDRNHLSLPQDIKINSNVLKTWNSTGYKDIIFGTGFGGISNLSISPDGYLYVVSFEKGKIYKIISAN